MLSAHAGGVAGTLGTRGTGCPMFPACGLCAVTSSPKPQPCPAVQLCCSPVCSLPCKTRGRVRAQPASLSSLFCTEELLAQAGTCISSASDAASLPGNVKGSFELISRKACRVLWSVAAGTPLRGHSVAWEAQGCLGQDTFCRWQGEAPSYRSTAKSRLCSAG